MWPLQTASAVLDNGVDLAVTTDYRRVLAEIINVRYGVGAALPRIFPGLPAGAPLGIVRA